MREGTPCRLNHSGFPGKRGARRRARNLNQRRNLRWERGSERDDGIFQFIQYGQT